MKRTQTLILLAVCIGLTLSAWAQEAAIQITVGDKRDVDPCVSPDGNHLAFASNRTGSYNIYILTFGQSGIRQLTQSKKDDRYPSWSTDNKKVVFDSERTGHGDLYETAVDGSSGYLQLTDRADLDEYANYQPKGEGLLFASAPKRGIIRSKMKVVFADRRGFANDARVLADGDEPRFSPDGKRVVFVSQRTKNKDIWVMNCEGGMQTQLTTDAKDDQNPCFSPDGKHIVYASNRAGNFDIWVMEADGGNVRQLTSGPEDETQPCWSVGGYLYFSKKLSDSHANIFRIKAP